MIKMIASDMDGTLLSSHLAISETNKEAVLEAQAQGIEFMVATGRAYSEAKPALDDAGIKCCMITGNGAQIFDENGEAIVTFSIDKKTTKEIMTTLREKNLYFELMTTNGVYAESQPQRVENFATLLANQVPHLTFKMAIAMASTHLNMLPVHYINNYDDLLVDDSVEILKVIAFSDEGPKLLRPIADELEANGPLYVTASFPNNIEINHKDAQKEMLLS